MASYRNIQQILNDLQAKVNKLQAGNLTYDELNRLKTSASELYERIAVIEFKVNERLLNSPGTEVAGTESEKVNLFTQPESEAGFRITAKSQPEEEIKKPVVQPKIEAQPVTKEQPVIEFAEEHKKPVEKTENKLQDTPSTLADKLKRSKILDLKTAIPLNKKFLFMNTLFEGENTSYNEAIDKLNAASGLEDARNMLRDLSHSYGWDFEDADVISFTEYIERRHI
jgi:hypothetical protein